MRISPATMGENDGMPLEFMICDSKWVMTYDPQETGMHWDIAQLLATELLLPTYKSWWVTWYVWNTTSLCLAFDGIQYHGIL